MTVLLAGTQTAINSAGLVTGAATGATSGAAVRLEIWFHNQMKLNAIPVILLYLIHFILLHKQYNKNNPV